MILPSQAQIFSPTVHNFLSDFDNKENDAPQQPPKQIKTWLETTLSPELERDGERPVDKLHQINLKECQEAADPSA